MPRITIRLVPMPSIAPPMALISRHRSWTCGSQAAFSMTVVPSASAAAMTAFSVPVTEASSRNTSAPTSCFGALKTYSPLPVSTVPPRASRARTWVSMRRRPITSPPGSGSRT